MKCTGARPQKSSSRRLDWDIPETLPGQGLIPDYSKKSESGMRTRCFFYNIKEKKKKNYQLKEVKNNKILFLLSFLYKKSILFYAFVTSLIVQLLGIFTQFFIFKGLGVNLNVLYSLLVFPIITLASFFIPSLNGLGVQDLLYERLFIGVTLAISASLLYHFFRLLVSLIGGILYAFEKNYCRVLGDRPVARERKRDR